MPLLAAVCLLTFLHYVGAQMRGPILPLYAAAHGATATGVGFIVAAHMAVAAAGSIPLGRASDVWGRRPLLLGGMVVTGVTSLLLPLFEGELALMTIYGLAGFGVAAFTPSALSLVGDAAAPGRTGYAFAWYTTAHYGAIAVGPFLGGLAAQWWGYRESFVGSAIVVAAALVFGLALPAPPAPAGGPRKGARFVDIRANADVWAGWMVSVGGLTTQGVVFTFFPLLAHEWGLTPATIGLVFLVLGLANTLARFPAGWLVDRTGRCTPYAVGGVLIGSVVTALLPSAIEPAAAALYLGLALGSFALGPVITHRGYSAGFLAGGAAGMLGALLAAVLWGRGLLWRRRPAVT